MVRVEEFILERSGYTALNPVQKRAINVLSNRKNVVVSSPTASGKTLIAEYALLSAVFSGGKAVYTCPLRALAAEHFKEFSRKYPEVKAVLSTGDYDSSGKDLGKYDVIFTTYEKLDSLTRHSPAWIDDVGTVVIDEIHELDSQRGATLEVVITKLKKKHPLLVALSATIPNAEEIASWLDAELIYSEWRPVELVEGVYFGGVFYTPSYSEEWSGRDFESVVEDTLSGGKQILIFTSTRKNAETLARKLTSVSHRYVSSKRLAEYSERILSATESPTSQCRLLSDCVRKGTAFHHAGLLPAQREAVEDAFRSGVLPVIVSTPTLAAGVNLPAFRVLIHSVRRYTDGYSEEISVREYKQMAGRAGRPKYDDRGEAIILARNEDEVLYFMEKYVMGVPENVYSRLSSDQALRFHILSLISSGYARTEASLLSFISDTFYSLQYGDIETIVEKTGKILRALEEMGFIRVDDFLEPTALGKRVSELYLDPLTAYRFIKYIENPKIGDLSYVFVLCNSTEMRPFFSVSSGEEKNLWEIAYERCGELPYSDFSEGLNDLFFINRFKTALVLEKWINEVEEEELLKEYDVSPGSMRAKVGIAEWLSYSIEELSKIVRPDFYKYAHRMTLRIKHGIKDELVELVEVKHVGRVRARLLWNAGYRTIDDIVHSDPSRIAKVLGYKVAEKVLAGLGVKLSEEERRVLRRQGLKDQTTIDMFVG